MALRIRTVLTYPLDGSTEFIIPFEYLARKFVTVTLIGQDRKELVLNQDFRFVEKTKIQTSRTWTSNEGYALIEIRRFTSATERLVDFADGSILRAYDLNISQVQTLHVAEEARDLTADTIGVNNDGNLDARGRRIVNVSDAVDDYDAINLHMMKTWNTSALNSANAAAASQSAAKTSENNSKTSENNSKTSENNSKTSENNAYQWAQRAEDSPVQGSEFSSYHYSRKSAKSAAAASVSEGNAKTSENNSKTSETNAKTSETNAATSATKAATEAAKLTNMNDFAAALSSVSGNTVTYKGGAVWNAGATWNLASGDWLNIYGNYATGTKPDYATNGHRYFLRSDQRADVYAFENVGNYHSLAYHVYQVDGTGAFFEMRHEGTFMAPRGLFNGSEPTTFNHNIILDWGGRSVQYQENGDITSRAGSHIFSHFWDATNLSGALVNIRNNAIIDMWLGGQEWFATNQVARKDYALGGGGVCTGYTQDATGGKPNAWLDGIFFRRMWIRYGDGNARIISSV